MDVLGIRWVGVATTEYAAMRTFLCDVLGLHVRFEESTTVELETSAGDRVQLLGPGDPYFDVFSRLARGPVPLFEVADLDTAVAELRAAGTELLGPLGQDAEWEWVHVRAPDGHMYELGARRRS